MDLTESVDAGAQAPDFRPDDGADDTVSAGELLENRSQKTVETGGDDAAGNEDPADRPLSPDDTSKSRPGVPSGQAAIDRAIGERLRRERRKWEQRHGEELAFAREMARLYPNSGYEDILRLHAGETAFCPPDRDKTAEPAAETADPAIRELAARIARESGEVREQFPEFDARRFITDNPEGVARMRAGYSLRDAYVLTQLDRIVADSRRQGEAMAAQRIRARNARIPETTRGGAAAMGRVDVAALTDEEFARIESMVASGRKVRLS